MHPESVVSENLDSALERLETAVALMRSTICPSDAEKAEGRHQACSPSMSPAHEIIINAGQRINRIEDVVRYLTTVIEAQNEALCGRATFS